MTTTSEIDELYENWKGYVARASRKIARQFAEIEEEDLVQELFLWVFSEKPDHTNSPMRLAELRARDIAWDYRRSYMANSGQYLYRTEDVRKILKELAYLDEYWDHSIKLDVQPLKSGNTGVSSLTLEDRVVLVVDVQEAFKFLSPNYKGVIEKAYRDGVRFAPDSAEERQLSRAVDRLTDYLNYKEHLARRR